MRGRMTLLLSVAAGLIWSGSTARAALLSDLIAGGGSMQSGDTLFSAFSVLAQNSLPPDAIDVTAITDPSGNFGLRFTPSAPLAIDGQGGSRELMVDISFAVQAGPGMAITGFQQAYVSAVAGSGIISLDSTGAAPAGSLVFTVAANCMDGGAVGCPTIPTPADLATLSAPSPALQVDRLVELIQSRSGTGTGSIASWDVTFSQSQVGTGTPGAVPEPSTWMSLATGVGLCFASRRRKAGKSNSRG